MGSEKLDSREGRDTRHEDEGDDEDEDKQGREQQAG